MKLEIGLFGNPNCGKTTLFNELTGGNRSVGNWTGTTVTLDIGHFHYKKQAIDLVDIPGIYSLFTHTPEQLTGCLLYTSSFIISPKISSLSLVCSKE